MDQLEHCKKVRPANDKLIESGQIFELQLNSVPPLGFQNPSFLHRSFDSEFIDLHLNEELKHHQIENYHPYVEESLYQAGPYIQRRHECRVIVKGLLIDKPAHNQWYHCNDPKEDYRHSNDNIAHLHTFLPLVEFHDRGAN
jgi:hypothetical protein